MRIGRSVAHLASEAISELLWPTRCVGCEQPGELICEECRASLPWIDQRLACPICGAPYGFLTCTSCEGDWELRSTVAALSFEGTPQRMVRGLKDAHELRLAPLMAEAMCRALEEAAALSTPLGEPRFNLGTTDAICFVPATAAAYARRGFDHMELVSKELASRIGLPLDDVLVRPKGADQRGLGRDKREANLSGTIRVAGDVSGMNLLLLDDVATTGASIREATRSLVARGARSVTACVFARVW